MKKEIVSENYEQEKEEKRSKVNQDKQTKKKSNAQKAIPPLIVAIVALVIILTCTLIAYYQVNKANKQNSNILEGVYAASYYSMVDNVNNLSVSLSKYSNLTTDESKINTMSDMTEQCSYILAGLSVLPISQENVVAATKFFNQVNGVCEAYTTALVTGQGLTQEQELLFDKIALVVAEIKSNLNKQSDGMYDTGFNFVDAGIFDNTGMNELSASMGDMVNIDYPAMIFDGPFSTALETKEVNGLPEEEVTADEAKEYLQNTVYSNREVSITQQDDADGDIATYNFKIGLDGKTFYAQVSKRGGLLITLSGYAETGDAVMESEQAVVMAETFANNIGFENMGSVWLEVHNNVAYINLAPIVDDVIYYPDLVKVKIDLTAQDVIGFEAVNYALNHVDRTPEFNITLDEAEDVLGFDYEILKTSKAVILLDSGKEIACYEFMLERIGGIYFYYINANDNSIAKTLKLVSVKGVQKLI